MPEFFRYFTRHCAPCGVTHSGHICTARHTTCCCLPPLGTSLSVAADGCVLSVSAGGGCRSILLSTLLQHIWWAEALLAVVCWCTTVAPLHGCSAHLVCHHTGSCPPPQLPTSLCTCQQMSSSLAPPSSKSLHEMVAAVHTARQPSEERVR